MSLSPGSTLGGKSVSKLPIIPQINRAIRIGQQAAAVFVKPWMLQVSRLMISNSTMPPSAGCRCFLLV
jgi:hypothetical protein